MLGKCRIAQIAGVAGLSVMAGVSESQAFDFEYKDVKGYFDTTVTTGILFRLENADGELAPRASGDRNFNKWNSIGQTNKATHDFSLQYHNVGVFARGTYFYDTVIDGKDNLRRETREAARWDAKFLDYFVYGNWELGETSKLHLRAGSQVLSWGESTFFTNGINVINPQDVVKARQAGAEVKEILVPLPMLWAGVDITDTWSVEAFQLLKWQETEIDPAGTFFSTSDLLGDGSFATFAGLSRTSDKGAHDTGTYGVATHITVEPLGYTDIGFYFINYSSYNPLIGIVPDPDGAGPGSAFYRAEYPENIKLYGVSFNTTLWKTAVAGEFSYQDDFPIQLGGAQLVAAAAAAQAGVRLPTYRAMPYSQAQVTVTYVMPPNMIPTTSQTSWATEIVWGHVYDYTNRAELNGVTEDSIAIRSSFGPQWAGLFTVPYVGLFDLNATIDFQIGLNGVAPAGGALGRKMNQLGLALEAVTRNKFSVRAEYTRFGGSANGRRDRDYGGITFKYSF